MTSLERFNSNDGMDLINENIQKIAQLGAIKFHHLVVCSEEEIQLIETEMRATMSFYLKDSQELVNAVQERSLMTPSAYNIGALQALHFDRLRFEETLHSLFESFGQILELESLPVDKFIVLPHHVYNLSNNSEYLKNIHKYFFIPFYIC